MKPQKGNGCGKVRKGRKVVPMKILILGAGVLGCNMAHNFYQAGKDVTLFARGKWGAYIKENGLVIKNKLSIKPSCDRIPVIDELREEDVYDVIFVCVRYTQLSSVMEMIRNHGTKNIIFIGNNMNPEGYAGMLAGKNVLFGFVSSAGHRERNRVVSIDMKKITVGDLKSSNSNETLLKHIFEGTKYRMVYEANMGDYLISHGAFIVPAVLACYCVDGNLKRIRKDEDFIRKVIDSNGECYHAVETLGYELLPKGEEQYRSEKYRKMMYRFYRLMFSTFLGRICISDHAMNAVEEMNEMASELEAMIQKAGVRAEHFLELKKEAAHQILRATAST